MIFSRRFMILCLTGFSVFSILGAWFFQYGMGLAPCQMCFYQRYPHWAAAFFGALAFTFGNRVWCYLAGLSALVTSLVGFYHSGIERKWWLGPESCTSRGQLDTSNLLSMDGGGVALCDEIPWDIFGITMANLNAVGSLVVAGLWIWVAHQPKEGRKVF
ncbi:disulfide bond formation protein B [Shimia thalassica]|uniref:disulfide bond formation protein B n=1 Tax=Shimia thalassica TaxID=1715693 RepID=UPI0026E24C9D|nr:disulfide bond formation protein B [Shimia thalassica]MDO6799405.1 disulfide bond formation protein B [Shimia thalassica]